LSQIVVLAPINTRQMAAYEDTDADGGSWIDNLAPEWGGRRRSLRAQRVARQLVELSRLNDGFEVAELRTIELMTFLSALLRDYPSVVVTSAPAEAQVLTDSRRLAAVLFAVLDNALVHGASPVEVCVTADAISIKDGGSGFPPQLLSEATRPFSTGSRVAGHGVGLGLAIAAAQMRLLSGALLLDNGHPSGACVTVRFTAPAGSDDGQLRS
jgi:signal transduction histidine kinase